MSRYFETFEQLEAAAIEVAHRTGGLRIHAEEGAWCVHVGPANRFAGCIVQSIDEAVAHAALIHMDAVSGAPVDVRAMRGGLPLRDGTGAAGDKC